MKKFCLIVFSVGVFGAFSGERAFSCDKDLFRSERFGASSDQWRDGLFQAILADKSVRETDNEDILRVFQGDTKSLFGLNFMRDRITDENSYVLIKPYDNPRTAYIGRITEKKGPDRLIVEIRTPPWGKLRSFETSLQPSTALIDLPPFLSSRPHSKAYIEQGHPGLGRLFDRRTPSPLKITSASLNIPEQSGREQKLKEPGFGPAYTKGLDQVEEWLETARILRKLNADPYQTSLDYYEDQIPIFIDYMEQGVEDSKQRKEFDHLEKQAFRRWERGNITYEWWVKWTFLLSLALDPAHSPGGGSIFKVKEEDMARVESVIDQYPLNILMPAPMEAFGIMLANEVYSEGVFPVSMARKGGAVDGIKYLPPSQRYLHDIGHTENFLNRIGNTYSGTVQKRLNGRLKEMKATLPPEIRKKVELGHYILEHETTTAFVSNPPFVRETLFLALSHQVREGYNFKGLMNFPQNNSEERNALIHDIKETFVKFFIRAQKGLPARAAPPEK